MEVVQTGPLVCASRPSSSHQPPHARLSHADPTSALHVHTEEGGGGLDPSWWKISASGSWDGGERRMRYGKIIDDRSGSIPGAIQRRKLEMLETHAPGASMRVVHSQSHASWVQDPSDSNSGGMSTSISSSRRSVLSSSSSSTRVTSFRQWSSNFAQNSTNSVGVTQEARPTVTEFGNLQLALNPLDVSFLRTKGNVGRSGSIGARRPPSRGRRLSTDVPSDSSAGEDHSKTPSPIPKGEGVLRAHEISNENRAEKSEENSKEAAESRSEWTPSSSKTLLENDEKSKFALRLQTVLHRKRSVSSEDVRAGEGTDEEDASPEDTEGKWRRGASVRRSLPSSEWKSVVAAADETRQRLRPRDPFKSSSVPALGGISSRRESFVTAESLREMKGRLKHRSDGTDSGFGRSTRSETPPKNGEPTQEDDDDSANPRTVPFFLRAASREGLPGSKQLQEAQDDRRKSWSMGCRNFAKRSFEEESESIMNRRRSYAFEFAADENGSSEDKENTTVGRTLHDGRGDAQRGKLWVDTHPYVQNRVNEVLKKWSAISKEEVTKGREEICKTPEKSPMVNRRVFEERKGDSPVKSSTTWLENGDFECNSAEIEEAEFSQATTTCGGRTSLRINTPKSPFYKDETISSNQEKQESSFSISGEPMEDYMTAHGLKPIDWTEEDAKGSSEPVKNEVVPASAGISVTFSNTDGENNSKHHYSVTHFDSRETEMTNGSKVRSSKKVEFSKTEVHFAAESGRFHIVETAGKPPPSNNFRRRRRSPTGAMSVDSARVGLGSQAAVTNGMRFGDSPYEMRLLAGSENVDHSFRNNEDEFANGEADREDNRMDEEGSLEYKILPSSNAKTFNELVIEEERDSKEVVRKISETETSTSTSTTFLHLGSEDPSEKPRSILRNSAVDNLPPWKITLKGSDESENEDSKPKFGGVRLRPVASGIGHLRVSVTNNESQEHLNALSTDKDYSCALSPGQMELQKLLRSLRHVSMTYSDDSSDTNTTGAQVANGGGMEVRISSASSQPSGTNTVIIGGDSSEVSAPLSVAQRVREVEERRQRELMNKVAAVQKNAPRTSGQFSTRVTLGSTSSSVVSMESQVQRKTSLSQIENTNPVSPKPAEKLSTQNNKIARIHNAQGIASRLSGDDQHHSQVAASSDIKICAHLTENHSKLDQAKEVPMVTCISLGFQDKLKDGLKYAETRNESKDKPEPSSIGGSKIDGLPVENPKRITAKVVERKVEGREKSPEVALHSRTEKYCLLSSSKDVSLAWRRADVKNKDQDDLTKMDTSMQDRSSKRGKELSSDLKEKQNAKPNVVSLGSPIAVSKSFQNDVTSFQKLKEESRVDDIAGQFSVKMKVVKNQAEEKSGATLDPAFPSNIKSSTHAEYLHQRKTNISSTSSKLTENDSTAQKSKRESSPRVNREPRAISIQASKSPIMEQKSKVLTRSSKPGIPETSSPSSGRVVRKRLRKRGSGSTSKSLSSSDGRKPSIDDESAILEELTKAADEILHAVNGYSDEASSDEDVEASKTESRTKRRQVSRKEVTSRKLSSSSSKDSKGGGSLRNTTQRTKEGRSRVTNGAASPSAEAMQRIVPEIQVSGTEASRTSHRMNLGSPVSSPNLHSRSCSKAVVSDKSTKSKQHSPLPVSKKSMTRIEPTNRVAEVKLIEKRPPLPPAGQRRPTGTKERSEALGRGSHGKVKTTTSLVYNKDGEAEIVKETKRPLNIARALEAVMPESRTKTKRIDQKVEVSSALKVSEIQKKVNPTSTSSSAQSSPSATLSMDRKKVASSREGDKTSRRRAHQSITST